MARDVIRAVRAERPDLLHTHLVHADVYGAFAARALRLPLVSTRHNDDRYLLGPYRYVDRAFARGSRRLIAISEAVRDFLVRAGHKREKIVTIPYGLDELPAARSALDPGGRRRPGRRAARCSPSAASSSRRTMQPSCGHSLGIRGAASGGTACNSRQRPARGRDPYADRGQLGLDAAVVLPGRTRDPRLARARRRLRPHVALGGLRDRPARGDAGRAAGCRDQRKRRARGGCRWRNGPARGSGRCRRARCRARPLAGRSRAGAAARRGGTRAGEGRVLGCADDREYACGLPATSVPRRAERRLRRHAATSRSASWSQGRHRTPRGSSSRACGSRATTTHATRSSCRGCRVLDGYLFTFSDERIRRGLQYRAYRWGRKVRNPAVFALANRRYRTMFTADNEQLAYFRRPGRLRRRRSDVQPTRGRAHAPAGARRVRRHCRPRRPPLPGARRRQAVPRDPPGH